jgi:hypothetical protein
VEQRPLHWSERAKMYPASSGSGAGRPGAPKSQKQSRKKAPKAKASRKGFLIILLLLLVLAAAAAVVFLWYLPSRDSGTGDAEADARSLVRRAMSAIDTAYTTANSFDPQAMPPATLNSIDPTITFQPLSDTSAATSPTARAKDGAVNYAGTQRSYAVGTLSNGGIAYGVVVYKDTDTKEYYLGGQQVADWEQGSTATTAGPGVLVTTTDTSDSQVGPIAVASDAEAVALVSSSMTVVQSAFATTGTYEPATMTPILLQQLEPSITFLVRDDDSAATNPVSSATGMSVDFHGTAISFALGTRSESGNTFGVVVSSSLGGQTTTYYVNGQVQDWSAL